MFCRTTSPIGNGEKDNRRCGCQGCRRKSLGKVTYSLRWFCSLAQSIQKGTCGMSPKMSHGMACVLQNGCRHTPSEALRLSRTPSFDRGQNSGLMVVSMRTCTYTIRPVQPVLHSGWNCTNYFHIFYSKSSFQPFLILFFSLLSRAFFFPPPLFFCLFACRDHLGQ